MIEFVLLILCMTGFTLAQIPSPGACPPAATVQNFNRTKFAGKWFEAERYFNIYQVGGRCSGFNFINNDTYFGVDYTEIGLTHGLLTTGHFELTPVPHTTDARFRYMFEVYDFPFDISFWILGTDYDTYAIAFSCYDLFILNIRFLWILTRKRGDGRTPEIYNIIENANIDRRHLMDTNNLMCPIIS